MIIILHYEFHNKEISIFAEMSKDATSKQIDSNHSFDVI